MDKAPAAKSLGEARREFARAAGEAARAARSPGSGRLPIKTEIEGVVCELDGAPCLMSFKMIASSVRAWTVHFSVEEGLRGAGMRVEEDRAERKEAKPQLRLGSSGWLSLSGMLSTLVGDEGVVCGVEEGEAELAAETMFDQGVEGLFKAMRDTPEHRSWLAAREEAREVDLAAGPGAPDKAGPRL